VLLGQIYLKLKDLKAAKDQFEAALLLQPGMVDARVGVARTQLADQRFAEALQQLVPLSKSQPGRAEIFTLLAEAYSGLGKKAEAERAKSRARDLIGKANRAVADDKSRGAALGPD
jgi:predicted Zn-dependent protease